MNIEVKEIVNNRKDIKEEKSDVVKLPELIQEEPEEQEEQEEIEPDMEPEFEEFIDEKPCNHKIFGDIKKKYEEPSKGPSNFTNTLFILMGVGLLSKLF